MNTNDLDKAQGVNINHFLYPKTFPLGLRRQQGPLELPPMNGPPMNTVGSYSSPFAPEDLLGLGVLSEARNRVGF